MTNKILWGVVGVLVALGLILSVSSCVASCKGRVIEGSTVAGAEAKGGSKALQDEAKATGAQVAEADKKVSSAAEAVKVAQEGLQKLRKPRPATTTPAQAETPALPPVPGPPALLPEAPDNRDAIIAQQDVVIRALESQVKELESRHLLVTAQVRQLEGALQLQTQATIQAEMRAKAAEGLARANLWKGRVQGFMAGVATGGLGVAVAR